MRQVYQGSQGLLRLFHLSRRWGGVRTDLLFPLLVEGLPPFQAQGRRHSLFSRMNSPGVLFSDWVPLSI